MLMLLSFAVVASAARVKLDVTPVEKVVTLLEDLQTQVQEEGTAEGETYDKFACFCKDKTNAKVDSINEGETTIETLTADLKALTAEVAELKSDIATLTDEIAKNEAELKEMTEIREKEHAIYEVEYGDASAAVDALSSAIAHISGSKDAKLTEVKATITKTLALADALNLKPKNAEKLTALLQQPEGDVPEEDYTFHSDGIIKTLEDLLKEFKERKDSIQAEEDKAQAAFDEASKAKQEEIDSGKETLKTKEERLSEAESEIAEKEEELTETKALCADDKTYLKDLTGQCEVKAREWDQRSSLRNQELEALSKALEIISGTVADKATATGAGGRSEAKPEVGEAAPEEKLLVKSSSVKKT